MTKLATTEDLTDADTDQDLIERWRQHLAAAGYARGTQRLRVGHLVRLAGRFPGLRSATTGDLAAFMAEFGENNGPASLKTLQSSLRGFYLWCDSAGLIGANPTKGLFSVRVPRTQVRVHESQMRALAAAVALQE